MKKIITFLLSFIVFCTCLPALADNYSDMLEKANSYLNSQDYTKSIASFQLAQKLQPQNESAFLGEANIHIILEDYSKAYETVNTALEINPVSPDAWQAKCLIDTLTNNISAFEQDIIFAEICEADLTSLYLPAALMYSTVGLYDRAASYFMLCDFDVLDPKQRESFRNALVYSGNREEAENLGLVATEIRNADFDTAFKSDKLRLVRTAFPSISADNFEFSDEMWEALDTEKPANPIAEVASEIPNTEFTWLSLSPAGNSGILLADGTVICYHNGKYRIMYPSHARGVDDVNGNLAKVFSTPMQMLLSDAGVIYSPNGQYAAIYNINYTLMKMQLVLDPIIIDLSTGEMILTETYGNKIREENAGAVTTATFSSDGCYLYYMMYGTMSEKKSALFRYNLNTQQTELCYSGNDLNYYPQISETGDGSFIIIRDEIKANQPQGITRMTWNNSSWSGNEETFDLPMKYWNTNRLLSSVKSGYAVLTGKSQLTDGLYYSFQLVRPDDDFLGLNQYHAISKSGNEILTYTANDIISLFDVFSNNTSDDEKATLKLNLPFQSILASAISPDGHYVMLLSSSYGTEDNPTSSYHLNVVNLDDLTIKNVTGIDPSDILFGTFGANYAPVIEWNTDTLIIGTSEGIQAYQFELE